MNDYTYYLLGLLGTYGIVLCGILVLTVVADWIIFKKAGQKGWASIVPFYCQYIQFKIYWGNGWLFLVPIALACLTWIPVVGIICDILIVVIHFLTCRKQALAFGEGIGFTLGLFFLGGIFKLILAFGKYEYLGIPQDGVTYKDLKSKTDKIKEKEAEFKSKMEFEKPIDAEFEKVEDVEYEKPEDAK